MKTILVLIVLVLVIVGTICAAPGVLQRQLRDLSENIVVEATKNDELIVKKTTTEENTVVATIDDVFYSMKNTPGVWTPIDQAQKMKFDRDCIIASYGEDYNLFWGKVKDEHETHYGLARIDQKKILMPFQVKEYSVLCHKTIVPR